jgi:uncharacterized membrane protein YeiB
MTCMYGEIILMYALHGPMTQDECEREDNIDPLTFDQQLTAIVLGLAIAAAFCVSKRWSTEIERWTANTADVMWKSVSGSGPLSPEQEARAEQRRKAYHDGPMPVYVRVMFAATFGMVVTYEVVNSKDYEHVVRQLLLFLPAYTCIIWMTSVSKWRARLLLPSHRRLPLLPLPVHRAPSVL